MFAFFLTLTVISLIGLIVGFIWMLISSGQTQRRSGDHIGANIIDDGEDESVFTSQGSVFKGKATQVDIESSYSFAEIKSQVAEGHWKTVLPVILVAGGLIGLLLFGSFALFMGMGNKLVGGIIAAIISFSIIRIMIGFARA